MTCLFNIVSGLWIMNFFYDLNITRKKNGQLEILEKHNRQI